MSLGGHGYGFEARLGRGNEALKARTLFFLDHGHPIPFYGRFERLLLGTVCVVLCEAPILRAEYCLTASYHFCVKREIITGKRA